jgi:hypothetical protein
VRAHRDESSRFGMKPPRAGAAATCAYSAASGMDRRRAIDNPYSALACQLLQSLGYLRASYSRPWSENFRSIQRNGDLCEGCKCMRGLTRRARRCGHCGETTGENC